MEGEARAVADIEGRQRPRRVERDVAGEGRRGERLRKETASVALGVEGCAPGRGVGVEQRPCGDSEHIGRGSDTK